MDAESKRLIDEHNRQVAAAEAAAAAVQSASDASRQQEMRSGVAAWRAHLVQMKAAGYPRSTIVNTSWISLKKASFFGADEWVRHDDQRVAYLAGTILRHYVGAMGTEYTREYPLFVATDESVWTSKESGSHEGDPGRLAPATHDIGMYSDAKMVTLSDLPSAESGGRPYWSLIRWTDPRTPNGA